MILFLSIVNLKSLASSVVLLNAKTTGASVVKFKNIRRPARASKAKLKIDLSPSSVAEYESHTKHLHRSCTKVTSGYCPV